MLSALFRHGMTLYDRLWRHWHRVQPVDALISLSFETYDGPPRLIGGQDYVMPGDLVAHLHFNRDCLYQGQGPGGRRAAFHFARLLFGSLGRLAGQIDEGDPRLGRVKAFYGVTWFRPHGQRLGFIVERLPDSLLTRLRILHFRLFLYAFFPRLARREEELHPHAFWLPRESLLKHFLAQPDAPRVRKVIGR